MPLLGLEIQKIKRKSDVLEQANMVFSRNKDVGTTEEGSFQVLKNITQKMHKNLFAS